MPLRVGSALPGYRNARASSSARPFFGVAVREATFSSTSKALDDDPSPPKLEGFPVSNSAHQNINEMSSRGLKETRARTSSQKESRRHAQRQIDHDRHTPREGESSTQSRAQTSYEAPSVIPADPLAAPPGQSSGRRSLLDRVSGDRDLNPGPNTTQPSFPHQAATQYSADPFDAPLPSSGRFRGETTRRNVLSRVADDLFESPPETSRPDQKHPERGAPGSEAQRRGGYDYRGRGDGHRPDDARGGPAEDGGPSRNYYSDGPGYGGAYRGGPTRVGPMRGGPMRGGPMMGAPMRGGYAARGGMRGMPYMRGAPGRGRGSFGGGMRGARGRGRGRGRGGMRMVPGMGDMEDAESARRHMEHVVSLPPPQGAGNDQSYIGLFGRMSVLTPPVRGSSRPEQQWWAKGMTANNARKSEVLRLAGSYDTLLPDLPVPSDPSIADNPKEKARASYIWTTSLNSGVGLEIAKGPQDKVSKALQ